MLKSLLVQNYALISRLEIDFSEELSTLTGETGAGKSIILGAMGLILGNRADTSVLFSEDEKCVVEGKFWLKHHLLKSFFEDHDLDYEDLTHVRREINKSGKSRAFINDTPVNLTILRELASQLVDLHQQHESVALMSDEFQLKVIDSLANHAKLKENFSSHFLKYRDLKKELKELKEEESKAQQDLDYYQFQLNELVDAGLEDEKEQEELEEELNTLSNAESIKEHLYNALQGLSQAEGSAIDQLEAISGELRSVSNYAEAYKKLYERLESASIELQDISREIDNLQDDIVFDEARIEEVTDRLNLINRLEKKHTVSTVKELTVIRDELQETVAGIESIDEKINQKQKETDSILAELKKLGKELTKNRKDAISKFESEANKLLPEVGMPNGNISVEMVTQNNPSVSGFDHITFYFSANKGHNKLPLGKVASGGELSRVMLIIKSLVAKSTALPTLIFDEIDTGISGETARKVGTILKELAKNHQVIVITHLPQIAGKGNKHYYVYKESTNGKTATKIKSLKDEERIEEIAKMLSGAKPTDAAMANAREILND